MRRNGGIIGSANATTLSSASGIHDSHDCIIARKGNDWPKTKYFVSCSPDSGNHYEGESKTINITTDGYENGDTVYYSIASVSGSITAADFTDSTLTGSFTVNSSGVGSFSKTLVRDSSSETESYKVQIRDGSTSGTIIGEGETQTIPNPSYTVTPSDSTPNEGDTITFTVTGTNTYSGTHYYTISGTAANATDISTSLSTSFAYNGSTGSFTVTIRNDYTTEGNETFTVNVRVNSTSGPIVATSTVTIQDTSLTPSATITPDTTTLNEGSNVTFAIAMTNFTSGNLDWFITKSSDMEWADISPDSGTVTISSSSGSIVIAAAADGFTETGQTESFTLSLKSPEDGSTIGTSATVTLNDTSTGSDEPDTIEDLRLEEYMIKISQAIYDGRTDYKLTTNPHNITYDGDEKYIGDGGGDMYDSGNYTICVASNVNSNFSSSGTGNSEPVSYANTSFTTPSGSAATNYKYVAGGFPSSNKNLNSHGALIVAATTGNSGDQYCGLARGGNSGADGSGSKSTVDLYTNSSVDGFTVYASYMMISGAGDPSTCDLYILLGHDKWATTFGTITKYSQSGTGNMNDGMWSDSTDQNNVLAIATLAARTSGVAPVQSEMQDIVDEIIADIKAQFGYT